MRSIRLGREITAWQCRSSRGRFTTARYSEPWVWRITSTKEHFRNYELGIHVHMYRFQLRQRFWLSWDTRTRWTERNSKQRLRKGQPEIHISVILFIQTNCCTECWKIMIHGPKFIRQLKQGKWHGNNQQIQN